MSIERSEKTTRTTNQTLRWQECFAAAIEYFHDQIDEQIHDHTKDGNHPNRPETAREYFNEHRGWSDTIVAQNLLGWAPPKGENELVSHLLNEGFTRDELLATGLFTQQLEPRWNGRYVLPFFNAEGEPVYAISRSTGNDASNGHPDDFRSKYDNPKHTADYACISKPLFGLDTVREGEPVIVTEGIADAITVQQAGYPCVSPVTTRFTRAGLDDLLTSLTEAKVKRVYVLQDAERPNIRDNGDGERPTIEQYGPGVSGAVDTAAFLSKNDVDARVNTPPRLGLRKVDLDDYLQNEWGTLGALMRSAKPPDQHPAYVDTDISSSFDTLKHDLPNKENSEGAQSGLFSLDITDVTGLSVGYRGKNPLGHTGNSENYFLVFEGDREIYAYDHKRGVTYNPLTYLLCEAGTRAAGDPNGPLCDEEYFVAWRHAKNCGLLSETDPIPHRGLIHVAVSHDLCALNELQDGWRIPFEAYNEALRIVEDEYSLNPGRAPLGSVARAKHSYRLSRDAEDEELPELSLSEAHERCQATIHRAIGDSEWSLLDALPAQGKSHGVIKWAAETGRPLTVLAPRHELYDQSKKWCDKEGLETYTLPAFHDDCDCAKGKHGDEWKDRVMSLYTAGATGWEIHTLSEWRFGERLPCMEQGRCSYLSKWSFDAEEFDVLLGHYTHAYREDVTEGRVVAIDETPTDAYLHGFEPTEVAAAVNHYLKRREDLPFENYTDLTENRSDPYRQADALDWFDEQEGGVKRDGNAVMYDKTSQAHALAPLMTYALLVGEDFGNQWEHAALPAGQVAARNRAPSDEHDESELLLLLPPPLDSAESVICLDGTPWVEQWELCLGKSLTHYPVLNDTERAGYLRHALNLSIYQMSEAAKPYSSGYYSKVEKDTELIKQVGEWERRLPDLISSKKVIEQYDTSGVLDFVGEHEYYGNLKGLNDFKRSRAGIVTGSCHYGDTYVKQWGALAGEPVERIGDGRGMDLDYGPLGKEILQDMREHEVLQALMRFGRDGGGAKVYVSTGALPEWVPIAGKGEVLKWSSGMKQVLAVIRGREEWKIRGLLTTTEGNKRVLETNESDPISERQVHRNLTKLTELGFITREKEGNGWLYEDARLDEIDGDYQAVRYWN